MPGRFPAGLLVLYEEAKGVRKPLVKIFNPGHTVETEINRWIADTEGILIHRIDWIPAGGLLGASVLYSTGGGATDAIQIRVPRLAKPAPAVATPLARVGSIVTVIGVIVGLIGMTLFAFFYPETWFGEDGGYNVSPSFAVKSTLLAIGLGAFLSFTGLITIVRSRAT